MDDPGWVTTAEAAGLLSISPAALRKQAQSFNLPHIRSYKTSSGHYRFCLKDVHIERYRHGKCHHLAWALHQQTGLPLAILHGPEHHPWLAHVGVSVNGMFLDILGLQEFDDVYAAYADIYATDTRSPERYEWTITCDEQQIEQLIHLGACKLPSPQDIEQVAAIVDEIAASLANSSDGPVQASVT